MPQCSGINQDGTRCRNITRRGQQFCHLHRNQSRRRRRFSVPPAITVTSLLLVLAALLGALADFTGILGDLGVDFPLFHKNPPESRTSGNSVTIGRDMRDSTIIQSEGDITLNENPIPSATTPESDFAQTPLSEIPEKYLIFLPVIYKS